VTAPVSDVPMDGLRLHATATTTNRAHFLMDVSKPV
jgi:hypothetical protein